MIVGFDASRAFVSDATGTENYSLNLLKALMRLDRVNEYRVYLRGDAKFEGTIRTIPKNFKFKVVRPSRLWTQLGLALETWRSPVDVLFVPAHTLPVLGNPKVKTVVAIHDLGVEYLPNFHKFPQRYYLDFTSKYASRHADSIIAVSRTTKQDLVERYKIDPKRIFVVHEGVDTRIFKPQSKSKVEGVKKKFEISADYILFVGTIQPRKNLEMLIEAFSKIPGNPQLIIAGKLGWDYEEILAAPKKFRVKKWVRFIGRVPDADLPSLYSGARLFAFPSLFEGFGLPILEALACGCSVVASDIGPHREILKKLRIKNEELKILKSQISNLKSLANSMPMVLVKPTDTNQWVSVLYQTITKGVKRSTFNNLKSSLEANFSWDEAAKKTFLVFEKLFYGKNAPI